MKKLQIFIGCVPELFLSLPRANAKMLMPSQRSCAAPWSRRNNKSQLLTYISNCVNFGVNNRKKISEGVSSEFINSRTPMSLDDNISKCGFLKVAGKALGVAGVGSVLASLPLSQAFAGDDAEQVESSELARLQGGYRDSRNYAKTYEGIGVTIFWGDDPETNQLYGVSKEELAGHIENGFKTAGERSKVNFEPLENAKGATVRFHTGDHVSESVSVGKLLRDPKKYMGKAIADYRVARDLDQQASLEQSPA